MDDQRFFEEAAAANGDRGLETQKAFPLPKWVDPEKIKAGQKFIRDHFFSVIFAHFISLIFLLCYSPVRRVLVRTHKSETSEKAVKRYLSTLVHIKLWYEQDLLHREGEAAQDVFRIRRVHSRVSRYIEKRCPMKSTVSEAGKCGFAEASHVITQLDMIVTQFGFMGFVTLFPSKFGIFTEDPTGLEGFIHLWALIGHLLGIEDRFNLGLEINFPRNRAILEKILLPELKVGNKDSLELCQSLVNGMANIVPFLSFNSVLIFVKEILPASSFRTECPHLTPNLSMYDFICFYLMTQCTRNWLQFTIIQQLCTGLLRLAITLGSGKILEQNNSVASTKVSENRGFSRSA